jgi:hypothetical protein
MAIVYHFANPDILNIIRLVAFIFLTYAGFNIKKRNEDFKSPILFLIGGFIGVIWYIAFFLIPAFMFTTPPTAAEIQFGDTYIFVLHYLVPSLILMGIIGFINIILGLKNKANYGLWLLISGILFIISILLDLFPSISNLIDLILSIIVFIGFALSSSFYLYFSIKFKNRYLITFSVLFIFSVIFSAFGLNLFIPIY